MALAASLQSSLRISGPKGRWISGNLAEFERDRLGFLLAARDQYGGLVQFDGRTTIINDAQAARTVLMDQRFEVREDFLQRRLTAEQVGQALAMRKLLSPTLRRARLGPEMLTAWTWTRASMRSRAHGSSVLLEDPMSVLEQVTGRTTAWVYFNEDGDRLPDLVRALLDGLSEVIGNPFALPATWPVPSRLRIRRRHQRLLAAVEPLLEARRRRPEAFADRASDVMAPAASDPDMTVRRVADLLIGALLAAYRVPAAAAAWTLMLLADHCSVQDALRPEAERFEAELSAGTTTEASNYPTAFAVVLETLRLYPTTWLLSRYSATPSHVAGHGFPPRHNFLISPYVIHRDAVNFERPSEFLPERWTRTSGSDNFYLPFGYGVHRCPGNHLAVNMLVAITLGVVADWQIERTSRRVVPDSRTTLLPAGLAFRLSRRTGSLT